MYYDDQLRGGTKIQPWIIFLCRAPYAPSLARSMRVATDASSEIVVLVTSSKTGIIVDGVCVAAPGESP